MEVTLQIPPPRSEQTLLEPQHYLEQFLLDLTVYLSFIHTDEPY